MAGNKQIFLKALYLFSVTFSTSKTMSIEPLPKGIVVLDSLTFNKTISAFRYSFVCFNLLSFSQSLHHLSDEQNKKE